ncbi:putative GTP diphosphokinase RSH1, chloroplastic isoform X2 [Camellia sinensis]|uniref:putative GTP diphosphokinase RSH1, chloroplastic isoform X2 n=1 Tax=Camellia sinensis TaxID=4442 RepID=UPI00103641F5|nr:putative GTP diphosphokinase RSH1, chloroplastic isoform X2 [Camellia sinensis]
MSVVAVASVALVAVVVVIQVATVDLYFTLLKRIGIEAQSNCRGHLLTSILSLIPLRIIIKPKPCIGVGPLCTAQQMRYHVLRLLHGIWTPIPRSMKDYITYFKAQWLSESSYSISL